MPGQGEQHNSASNDNPFKETKPHVSEYTAAEIATLSRRLEKQLGPEYISSRPGAGGGKVDENQTTGKDIGYGHIENCKGKAPAFEKAKKEGTTDALKRALRNFGNLLGNCVYDKDYVARVTKLKIAPTKWDPENLHRHQDFAPPKKDTPCQDQTQLQSLPPIKREPPLGRQEPHEDEFGSDDFDEVDFAVPQGEHPDEVILDPDAESGHFRRRNSLSHKSHQARNQNINQNGISRLRSPLARSQSGAAITPATSGVSGNTAYISQALPPFPQQFQRPNLLTQAPATAQGPSGHQHSVKAASENTPGLNSSYPLEHASPAGFFTARAAENLQSTQRPLDAPAFNPHLESPSIRKTPGVDHSKTKPVNRDMVAAPTTLPPPSRGSNLVNPQADKGRKVGMPVSASPLQNRGSYKPPQMKRPAEGGRSALEDVTSASVNVPAVDGGGDLKRQRIGGESLDRDTGMLNV
ncbi:MAG: hypothetical protein Q9217_003541 [Psora testacea]